MAIRGTPRPRAGIQVAALAGIVTGAALAPMAEQAAAQALPAVCADAEEAAFLDLLNAYRTGQGLSPVALSRTLSEASEFRSSDMAAKGYFAHTTPDGTTVEQNLRNFGYEDATYGENILAGAETAEGAFDTWRNSAPHAANMSRGAFAAIGIGRAFDATSPYGWYWTTIFGGEVDERGSICGEATGDRKRGVVNDPDVNLRSGPGLQFGVSRVLPEGAEVEVTGDPDAGFLPVEVGGAAGWIAAEWLDVAGEPVAAAPTPAEATVTETVNLRQGPSREAAVLGMVPGGDSIEPTGRSDGAYVEAIWDGTTGWIDAAYVSGGSSPAEAAQPAPVAAPSETATTTTEVNVRVAPDRSAAVVGIAAAGAVVSLTGEQSAGFFGVTYDGAPGWIDAAYLR